MATGAGDSPRSERVDDVEDKDSPNTKIVSEAHDTLFDPNDNAFEGLSMYERKALVIDREVDKMGMGKYQWYIWGLCGLGYFLDLLWAQAFGLIATPLQQELGFNTDQLGNIFTAFSSGLCAGAFVWGVLVDIIGRRAAFNGTVLITCIFGLCLGAPDTYNAILVLTAFNGFGIGGNIPIDTTICLEFLPKDRRFLLAMLSIFQPLGVVVCSGIAYGFVPKFNCLNNVDVPACSGSSLSPPDCLPSCFNVPKGEACCSKGDNMGWRYLTYCLGGISLFVFVLRFFLFTFQESPKFLLSKGKDEEAIKVIQHVAKVNGQETSLTMATFNALENSFGTRGAAVELPGGVILTKKHWTEKVKFELMRMKILFSSAMLIRLTLLVWVIYAFDYWGFSIAGSFLPTILLKKNSAINVSISETYRDYIIIYLPGIVGVALGALMVKVNRVGRKWAMVISSALMATSLFLFAAVNTQASNVGLNVMEYFFQSMFNAVLYGWTPEAFPAPVRGTASGIASFWGRLFSIWAPLVAARILDDNLNGPLYMAGAGVFVCTIAVMFLPSKAFDLNALMGK